MILWWKNCTFATPRKMKIHRTRSPNPQKNRDTVTATVDEGIIIIIIIILLEANGEFIGRRLAFRVMVPLVHPEEGLGVLMEMVPLVVLVEDRMADVAAAMLAVVVRQVLHNRKMLGVAMSGLK